LLAIRGLGVEFATGVASRAALEFFALADPPPPQLTGGHREGPLMNARACVLLSLLAACAARQASAIDETRRQVGSQSIDAAFNFTGSGVRLGQIDTGLPLDHNKVAYTARTATDGKTLHALEVASVMVSSDARYSGMAPKATLYSDPFRD